MVGAFGAGIAGPWSCRRRPLAIAATSFIFDSGTIIRDGALHDCPELLNMCITPPVTALVRSAPFEDDVR